MTAQWADAACRAVGTDLFFPDSGGGGTISYNHARAVCDTCPLWRECRFIGMAELYGMWGGLTPRQRKRARNAGGLMPDGGGPDVMDKARDKVRGAMTRHGDDVDAALAEFPLLEREPLMHVQKVREPQPRLVRA